MNVNLSEQEFGKEFGGRLFLWQQSGKIVDIFSKKTFGIFNWLFDKTGKSNATQFCNFQEQMSFGHHSLGQTYQGHTYNVRWNWVFQQYLFHLLRKLVWVYYCFIWLIHWLNNYICRFLQLFMDIFKRRCSSFFLCWI